MNLKITTLVKAPFNKVKNGFDEKLFKQLNPPFPPVKLLRFDGSSKGDLVSLQLNFIFFKQNWTSKITEDQDGEKQFYFIDQGVELPFFLKQWRHKHIINNLEHGKAAEIIDDIYFRTPVRLFDFMMYPLLWLQFMYRKPVYKKYFDKMK
ncbi:MAG: SRPBCC family protein [Cyclobacteriaceae bacterium]